MMLSDSPRTLRPALRQRDNPHNARALTARPQPDSMPRETDLHAWALEQARLLRQRQFSALDADGIADEIEDVGKSEQRELASRMAVLMAHLLKWAWQPGRRSNSWKATIRAQRKEIAYALDESPSLRPRLHDARWIDMVWSRAIAIAMAETGLEGLPEACPWPIESMILAENGWPEQSPD